MTFCGHAEGILPHSCLMPPPVFSFPRIGPDSDALLSELLQLYIREMAQWFEVEPNPDGTYSYDTAGIWERGYDAYLAKVDDAVAGFALIGPAEEFIDGDGKDVHEFFVLPEFRRGGVGRMMAMRLWNRYPGNWLVRVLAANTPALAFWRAAITNGSRGDYHEEPRLMGERPWVFFRFESRRHV